MKIMLVRHAEPDYALDSLTPKGRIEAELLSRRLSRLAVKDFFVSPKGRAQATAEYTLRRMARSAETLPWLAEFRGQAPDPDTGRMRICWDYRPRTWAARCALHSVDTWTQDPMYAGTNVPQVWEETCRGVDELLARYGFRRDGAVWLSENNTEDTLVLFCHFGISMAIIGYLCNLSPVVLWQCFAMQPSSVTTLITEERTKGEVVFRTMQLGDISHLVEAGEPWSTAGLFPEVFDGRDSTDPPEWEARRLAQAAKKD